MLLPFCVAMGATYPLAMSALRSAAVPGFDRSFSYLYAANVAGALGGTLLSAFVLIEVLGFRGTLLVAAAGNASVAAGALAVSLLPDWRSARSAPSASDPIEPGAETPGVLRMLFATGLGSIAAVLAREVAVADIAPRFVRALRDDRPINEYYLLRRIGRPAPPQ